MAQTLLPALFPLALLPVSEASFGGTEGPDLTRYLTICAVLLAGIGVLGWGFRRLMSGALRTRAAKRSLQIVDALPLGGKKRLCVVRCYDRTFALGIGDREVSVVAELDPVIGQESVSAPEAIPEADRQAFLEALDRARSSLPERSIQPARARPLSDAREAASNLSDGRGILG